VEIERRKKGIGQRKKARYCREEEMKVSMRKRMIEWLSKS